MKLAISAVLWYWRFTFVPLCCCISYFFSLIHFIKLLILLFVYIFLWLLLIIILLLLCFMTFMVGALFFWLLSHVHKYHNSLHALVENKNPILVLGNKANLFERWHTASVCKVTKHSIEWLELGKSHKQSTFRHGEEEKWQENYLWLELCTLIEWEPSSYERIVF